MTGRLRGMLAAALLVAAAPAACAPAKGAVDGDTPADLVDRWQRRSSAPAVVVAVDHGDGDLWTHAAGTRRRGGTTPVRADDHFRVASITKLFVTAVVMQLVEENRLDLDAAVTAYLPDAPVRSRVTIRQLLGHTSGIPDYALAPGLGDDLLADRSRIWSTDDVLDLVAHAKPEFLAGTAYTYSNTDFVLLGRVIERLTGRSWADAVRRRVVGPLELPDTTVPSHGAPPAHVLPGYHDVDNDGDTENIESGPWPALETNEGAAGAMVSTAADVALATRAIFDGPILEPESVATITAPGPFGRRYDGYGLGVEWARPDRQTRVVGHGGFLPGFRSVTWYVEDSDVVITVLANESRVDPTDLAELLLQRRDLTGPRGQ